MSSAKVTIFDVAQRAEVSIKTVSRVVNREPNVRDSTREKVERAISELKYRPDQSARNLASNRTHLIGLIYDDPSAYELPSSGYIIKMQEGALRACHASMHELLIHPCNFRKKNIGAELSGVIRDARLAGIVLAAPLSNMRRIVRAIQATETPLVRISPGKRLRGQPCVVTDDRAVSAKMTRYLAGLGHQRIAFITGDTEHAAVQNRLLGFEDGIRESGLTLDTALVVAGDNSYESGVRCAEKLLSRTQRPTAIFAANDDMAAGVMRTAGRLGLSIPEELSVAGFDDIILARQLDPTLTTISQPLAKMAETAVDMLTGASGVDPLFEMVPASLEIRESTGPAPGGG